jgi:hypothetical protein
LRITIDVSRIRRLPSAGAAGRVLALIVLRNGRES